MFDLPQRLSLPSQAAASIRKGIADGTWTAYLPSERRLCEMFQVSRPTIRTALHLLAEEGLIEIRQGRRNRLLTEPLSRSRHQSRLVGLIMHEPVAHLPPMAYHGISQLRAHLAEHGFATEILVCQARGARAQRRKLEEFIQQNRVLCCVLLSVSQEVQLWFSTHSVPALVLGSCHPSVKLPSLDIDYRSVCRHAAGIFLGKGHRRVALVIPNSGVAGDHASEEGFLEGMRQHRKADETQPILVRHDGTARNIAAKLDSLFDSARAPTGLLVAKPQHVFGVIMYLLQRGLTVPGAVSLIARDSDHVFSAVSPSIAHYSFASDAFEHRLSRLMLQLVSQGRLPGEPNLIFPRYFAGGTVRQLA